MYLFDCGLESDEWRKVMVIFTSIFVTFSVALYTTLKGRNKKWIVSLFDWMANTVKTKKIEIYTLSIILLASFSKFLSGPRVLTPLMLPSFPIIN